MLAFLNTAWKTITALLSGIFIWNAAKTSAKKDDLEQDMFAVNLRKEIEHEISLTRADPVTRKRLRDKWSK